MQNFKKIITTKPELEANSNKSSSIYTLRESFDLRVVINKNNQIHDIQPRTYMGVDIFSKYHGRECDYVNDLIFEMVDLYTNNF